MELSDIFSGPCLKLLEIFLEEEARQYGKNVNNDFSLNDNGKAWAKKLGEILVKEISSKYSDGFDYIYITSNSNLGLTNHALTLTPKNEFWNMKLNDLVVNLCSCGNLDHWGESFRRE